MSEGPQEAVFVLPRAERLVPGFAGRGRGLRIKPSAAAVGCALHLEATFKSYMPRCAATGPSHIYRKLDALRLIGMFA